MAKKNSRSWYEQRDFLKLRKEWYAKLENEGFEDIEHTNWDTGKAGDKFKGGGFRSAGDVQRRFGWDKVRYYELASQRVWDMREEGCWTKEQIEIFELHSQGMTNKDIWKAMGVSKSRIAKVIKEQKERFRDHFGE